jgi:hypothetical protein
VTLQAVWRNLLQTLIVMIKNLFSLAVPLKPERLCPSRPADEYDKRKSRYDLPQIQTHEEDYRLLFVPNLHTENVDQAEEITTFDIRRSVYYAFFGRPFSPVSPNCQRPSGVGFQSENSESQT